MVERRDLVCPVRPDPRKLDLLDTLVELVPVVVAMSDRLDEVREEVVVPLRPD